jgi:hypothetical protein
MLIGTKHQLSNLDIDSFAINYDGDPIELVNRAKYLGLYITNDASWDYHIHDMCKRMYVHISVLRRVSSFVPTEILTRMYKSFIQPRLDYGITLWGCTTKQNIDKIQRIQNQAVRIITGNFDFIHSRGINIVRSLRLMTIQERRDYFMCILMFKAINGLAPSYLTDKIILNGDVNTYPVRSSHMHNVYLPFIKKDVYKNSFLCKGGQLWNNLPDAVKTSNSLHSFKLNYKAMLNASFENYT